MSEPGILAAEREGPHVKFTFQFPPGYGHSFLVEQRGTEVNEQGVEEAVWEPVHKGTDKFIEDTIGYDISPRDPTDPDRPPRKLPGPRTYRALAYKLHKTEPGRTRELHTDGTYSAEVTVK